MSHVIEDFALLTARARKARLVLKPTNVGGRQLRGVKRKRNSEHWPRCCNLRNIIMRAAITATGFRWCGHLERRSICHRRFQRGSDFNLIMTRWFRCYAALPTGYWSCRPTGLVG